MRRFRYGEKGFTLIELLVVVAILGVLAAIVIPNVAKFIGSGTVEAANTEAHDVQLAVVAWMADEPATDYDGAVGPTGAAPAGPEEFLLNIANLQATYTFVNGEITAAAVVPGGKWDGNVTWEPDLRTWELV